MSISENNSLRKKSEEITNDIIQISGKSDETAELIMKRLFSFGDSIVEKTEIRGNIRQNIQCSKGCSYCCYAQVSVTPAEAIIIGNYLKENYSLSKTDQLLKKIKNNITLTKGKSIEERILIWEKTPCIFLSDNECDIHPVRPFICRAWHSLSVEQCKNAFKLRDKKAEIDSYPYRNYILGTIRDGLSNACKNNGCDYEPIEIATAIKTFLNHPSPGKSWINGENVFPQS